MDRIRAVLIGQGVSQTECAERPGKGFNTVYPYATNGVQTPIPVLYKIAEILQLDVRTLLIPNPLK